VACFSPATHSTAHRTETFAGLRNQHFQRFVRTLTIRLTSNDMADWYSKSLGHGASVYHRLRILDELRLLLCPMAESPYRLMIDAATTETFVFFPLEHAETAVAFGAQPCSAPDENGRHLVDLQYRPVAITDSTRELLQPKPLTSPLNKPPTRHVQREAQ
jgi:hypothetical protein